MKKAIVYFALLAIVCGAWQLPWGFFGHRLINRMAVFTLPPDMMVFYKPHLDYLAENAVNPDKRRYAVAEEEFRHYIDLDRYGEPPFAQLPRQFADALAAYTDLWIVTDAGDTLLLCPQTAVQQAAASRQLVLHGEAVRYLCGIDTAQLLLFTYRDWVRRYLAPLHGGAATEWVLPAGALDNLFTANGFTTRPATAVAHEHLTENGILPWHLARVYRRLVAAFDTLDAKAILRLSADLGHYVADGHVPLHTTENYNGQLTGQHGIHAFWESRLPELFAENDYDFWIGKANYIEDKSAYYWAFILASHSYVDSVLAIEQDLRRKFPPDQQRCYERRGNSVVQTPCREFAAAYHQRLNGMVEARMRQSIQAVGDLWYSAWVDAGQPDLRPLAGYTIAPNDPDFAEMEAAFLKGILKGKQTHEH